MTVAPIRDVVAYGGVRARVNVQLAGARLVIQVDVGFGDDITPGAVEEEWHELLPFPSARLLVYPPETVVAEKLEAVVTLGIDNSRMKDFKDLHWLQSHLTFEGETLTEAVINTFERRGTKIPGEPPIALTKAFSMNNQKPGQWNAFLRKGNLTLMPLDDVIQDLSGFLLPVIRMEVRNHQWLPSEKWVPQTEHS